jgi:hypothetical protein
MIVVNLYLQTAIVIHVGQNQQINISSTSNTSPFDNNINPFITSTPTLLLATRSTILLHATFTPSLTTPSLIAKTCVCYALFLSSIVITIDHPSPHVYRYLIPWSHRTLRPSMLHSCHNFEHLNLHSKNLIIIM